jgi:teichuronic acid biosynthesis glycosyltransferase TuaG
MKMIKPKISVIMPYFRKKKCFKKTIDSVLSQTFKCYEVIIIFDDNNLDELNYIRKIIKNKKKIKLIINKKNMGAGYSRNIGIMNSRSRYIAFLDCDDIWHENKLKFQYEFMTKNNYKLTHTAYYVVDKNEKIIQRNIIKNNIIDYHYLIKSCDIGLSTVMIDKSIIKFEKFPNLKTKEDYVLWLKLLKRGYKFFGLNKLLVSWRISDNSLSSSKMQKFFDAFKVYYYYQKNNIFMSVIFTLRLSLNALLKNYKFIFNVQ